MKLETDEYRDCLIRMLLEIYDKHIRGKGALYTPKEIERFTKDVNAENSVLETWIHSFIEFTDCSTDQLKAMQIKESFEESTGCTSYKDAGQFGKALRKTGLFETNSKQRYIKVKLLSEHDVEKNDKFNELC